MKAPDPAVLVFGFTEALVGFGVTVTITSSLLLLAASNFQLKNWKKVPVPLFPVIETVPLVYGYVIPVVARVKLIAVPDVGAICLETKRNPVATGKKKSNAIS